MSYKKYILTIEGSFYVSCTLDTCLDVIRQRLIWALSKKEVGVDAFVEQAPKSHSTVVSLCANIESKAQV